MKNLIQSLSNMSSPAINFTHSPFATFIPRLQLADIPVFFSAATNSILTNRSLFFSIHFRQISTVSSTLVVQTESIAWIFKAARSSCRRRKTTPRCGCVGGYATSTRSDAAGTRTIPTRTSTRLWVSFV